MLDNNTNKVIWVGVAIGVVSLIAVGAFSLFPDSFKSISTPLQQEMTKSADVSAVDLNIKASNGNFDSMSANSDLVDYAYLGYMVHNPYVGNKIHTNYPTRAFQTDVIDGPYNKGILMEMYTNRDKLKYLRAANNVNSDYIEIRVHYKLKNGKILTKQQATDQHLDTASEAWFTGIMLGLRSDEYRWDKMERIQPTGDSEGIITLKYPKTKVGDVFEMYVRVGNMDFDELELNNLQITNASHKDK